MANEIINVTVNLKINDKKDAKKVAELMAREILKHVEKLPKEEPLKVGDYAKVVAKINGHEFPIGSIVKIVSADCNNDIEAAEDFSGEQWFVAESELVRATEEEVAQAKAEVTEEEKWAKIGRKSGEFKKGDIVKVTQGYGEIKSGDIVVVTHADGSEFPGVTVRGKERYVGVKLITPVEARFDR